MKRPAMTPLATVARAVTAIIGRTLAGFAPVDDIAVDLGVDQAWVDRVHADAALDVFESGGARQANHAVLGGDVGRISSRFLIQWLLERDTPNSRRQHTAVLEIAPIRGFRRVIGSAAREPAFTAQPQLVRAWNRPRSFRGRVRSASTRSRAPTQAVRPP